MVNQKIIKCFSVLASPGRVEGGGLRPHLQMLLPLLQRLMRDCGTLSGSLIKH